MTKFLISKGWPSELKKHFTNKLFFKKRRVYRFDDSRAIDLETRGEALPIYHWFSIKPPVPDTTQRHRCSSHSHSSNIESGNILNFLNSQGKFKAKFDFRYLTSIAEPSNVESLTVELSVVEKLNTSRFRKDFSDNGKLNKFILFDRGQNIFNKRLSRHCTNNTR